MPRAYLTRVTGFEGSRVGSRVVRRFRRQGRVSSEFQPLHRQPISTSSSTSDRSVARVGQKIRCAKEFQVTVAYNKDLSPVKLNLGVGAYQTEEGKPLALDVVKRAEELLIKDRSQYKEYFPIASLAEFNKLSAKLILGDGRKSGSCNFMAFYVNNSTIEEKRVATVHCLFGTGSLRVGDVFLSRHYSQRIIYIPVPTWGNHPKIFTFGGLSVKTYRYYDPKTRGLDYRGMLEDLQTAPSGAIVLLHECAHSPTGVDPTQEQWEGIRQLLRGKALLPFFDSAYQGFTKWKP